MPHYDSTKTPGRWVPIDQAAIEECKKLGITGRGLPILNDPEFQLRASRFNLTPEKYLERILNEHKLRKEAEQVNFDTHDNVKEPVNATP